MTKKAKFNIGDVVVHTKQGYRAVIADVDPLFQASGRYNPQALKYDFCQRNPWYRLLVDNSTLITYVEECLLEKEPVGTGSLINNPNVGAYLKQQNGRYTRIMQSH
ncbi:heat shock protein HspQ [Legionella londiniensis]|uniref:Heat shock protein HspQ n=1 Tax=Legionella londiniensis TaxID=45068 RepID=A0A0W0VIX7_9GAMM|nr:heat shock protein HspQ [Legionella londiniensis]KTD19798.1 putative DNA-binding protein hemimethylated [Legionella londiniensis]STX92291.1 putative DNA-binding protein hemimethylated [Legionella londiniensis]